MVAVRALLLILLSAPTIRGRTNLPTLPEAIRLFQVESTNKLRQTIQDQESVIAEQQARIAELENDGCHTSRVLWDVGDIGGLELKRMTTKLEQCESTVVYMGNVMVQVNKVMSERQSLVEAQAAIIREADEEIGRQKNGSLICEAAAKTTTLQAEEIASLRSSLASALSLPQLSTAGLEQLDVPPFMLEMMESYNTQTKVIENLKSDLEMKSIADESMSSIAEGLAKLTSTMISATTNLEIVDQQAQVIKNQGKLIAQLTPVLQNTRSDILWHERAAGGETGVHSVSSCSCLPRSDDPGTVIPAKIEYHCGELSNRYSVSFCKDA